MRSAAPLAFLACVLIWGSTWLAIKVGYEGVGPFTGAALRFALAALLLVLVGLAWRKPLRLRGRDLRLAVFVGASMFVVDYGLIYWGEQFIPSGLTAVLFATLPLFVGFFAAWLLPGERITPRKAAGAVLGLVGLAVIFGEGAALGGSDVVPMLAILASAAAAAAANVASKRWGHDLHPVSLFATAMGSGALGLAALALLTGERLALPTTGVAWASVAYLAGAGSVVTFLLYFWLLKVHDAVKLSFVALLTPVVALGLGVLVLRESFALLDLAGGALVLLGVALALTARPSGAPAPPPAPAGPALADEA